MANQTTKVSDIIDPEVMADMISAKIPKKIAVTPFAKIDTTLVGVAGDTITVPQYAYIGDAVDVAEGASCETQKLTATKTTVTVKKAMQAVSLTDEAVLSGFGNPVGETNNQLASSIASKIDVDAMTALQGATSVYDGSAGTISYNGIVDAVDVFDEELNTQKVMFVHPKQVTTLRKDSNFISADKYTGDVVMTGEIGMIANCRIVSSKKVPVVEVGSTTKVNCYSCPIVKITSDPETEDETSALTIYLKRDTNVETERNTLARTTDISADKIYAAALTDQSKVVLAKFKK